jgi:hypothetical protein
MEKEKIEFKTFVSRKTFVGLERRWYKLFFCFLRNLWISRKFYFYFYFL